VPATVIAEAPGVRVKEGQVVTVTVRLRPVAPAQPSPAAGLKESGK
jgi:antitoxin (DNA-binding transcriptional repressor) of toxin-antitoxin stability system